MFAQRVHPVKGESREQGLRLTLLLQEQDRSAGGNTNRDEAVFDARIGTPALFRAKREVEVASDAVNTETAQIERNASIGICPIGHRERNVPFTHRTYYANSVLASCRAFIPRISPVCSSPAICR